MNIYSSFQIDEIINELNIGNTVAFGTDTVFGLSCIIDNENALNKIYSQKHREKGKKLPMMFSSLEMMMKYVKIDNKAKKLISIFSPGPITYVLEAINTHETIACRIPNDEWVINLIKKLDKPLYVTSANISGEGSLLKFNDVIERIQVDAIVNKDASGKEASTIVDVVNNYKILREGPISAKEIREAIK